MPGTRQPVSTRSSPPESTRGEQARPAGASPAARSAVEADMLALLRGAFAGLVDRPDPLGIDGGEVPGLPARWIRLDELRSMLLHPATGHATRDAALAILVDRARGGDADWQVALLGVLTPGLANVTVRAAAGYAGDLADIDSEAVAGLLHAVRRGHPAEVRVAARLLGAAFTRAWLFARQDRRQRRREQGAAAQVDPQSYMDPADLALHGDRHRGPADVLRAAVACRVLTRSEARLIAATRLDGVALAEIAAGQKLSHAAVRQRRSRAERRLTAWIAGLQGDTAVPAARPHGIRGRGSSHVGGHNRPSSGGFYVMTRNPPPVPPPPCPSRPGRPALLPVVAIAGLTAALLVATAPPAAAATPTLPQVIDNIRSFLVGILAGLALVFLTIGGVRYLSAGGDPGQVEKAKTALRSAVIGFALAALAPLAVEILQGLVSP